jgi:hypothetical protein
MKLLHYFTLVLFLNGLTIPALRAQTTHRMTLSSITETLPVVATYTAPEGFKRNTSASSDKQACFIEEKSGITICVRTRNKGQWSVPQIFNSHTAPNYKSKTEDVIKQEKFEMSWREVQTGEGTWANWKSCSVINVYNTQYYIVIVVNYTTMSSDMKSKLTKSIEQINLMQVPAAEAPARVD